MGNYALNVETTGHSFDRCPEHDADGSVLCVKATVLGAMIKGAPCITKTLFLYIVMELF
jgi:hypothetical protein